jgi:hypothetical protein
MKHLPLAGLVFVVAVVMAVAAVTPADDTVTIPKSRLEELERKATELEKLKKELNKAAVEKEQLKQEKEKSESEKRQLLKAKDAAESKAAKAAAAAPVVTRVSPPLASLPPLQEGETVNAADLLNHYLADASAAAQRYGRQRIRVEGEIAGFHKPMFVRPYKVLLKTADPTRRVVCTLFPEEEYKAVYPARNGTELVGVTARDAEVPLLKVGQTLLLEASCKGLDSDGVGLSQCAIKSVK